MGWQQFTRYWGALPRRHRRTVTPSLWRIRCGTSSQCSSEWSRCVKPRSNFPVLLTTRAAAYSKRCNLSVMVLGDPANTVVQPLIRDVIEGMHDTTSHTESPSAIKAEYCCIVLLLFSVPRRNGNLYASPPLSVHFHAYGIFSCYRFDYVDQNHCTKFGPNRVGSTQSFDSL